MKKSAEVWLLPYLIKYTGLRKGEALALTFVDIDRDAREITVSKSVYYIGNNPHIKTPKTAAGERTVPIFDPLLSELPTAGKCGDYLFSDDGGKSPLTHRRFGMCWSKFAEETGISCTAHQLRHSYATMLYDLDVDSKVAQALLGHATEAMTREVYTHLRPDKFKSEKDKINLRLAATAHDDADKNDTQITV